MPQPVDMLSEIVRTSMAERVQEATTRANMAALQHGREKIEEDHRAKETLVEETAETENPEVDVDGKKKDQQKKRSRKRHEPDAAEEASHTVYAADEKSKVLDDPDVHDLDVSV